MQGPDDPSTRRPPSEHQDASSRSLPPPLPNMLAAARIQALPSPPHPDRNNAYPSDPARYGRTFSPAMSEHRLPPIAGPIDRLPSVSQLLTPSSQAPSAGQHSSYYERPTAPDRRMELPSPHPQTPADVQTRPATSYFQHDTWRDAGRESRDHTQINGPVSDSLSLPRAPGSVGAPSPLQLNSDVPHSRGPPQPAVRTPTTWLASQSPQSTASTIQSNVNANTPQSRSQDKPATGARKLLGERNLPGQGRVYVYDDGTKIPTIVDGEPVNGQWGMTKAGKPRKRMPQACVACRQKKIKCDPGEGKCAQCEKSGKDCRYSEGQRGHKSSGSSPSRHAGPGTPSSDQPGSPHQFSAHGLPNLKRAASVDLAKHKHKRIMSAHSAPTPPRQRFEQNWTAAVTEDDRGRLIPAHGSAQFDTGRGRFSSADRWALDSLQDGKCLDDPFLSEPDRAAYYLQRYFECVNNGTYMIFPRRTVEAWAHAERAKSRGEVAVLYGMLACGSLFSDRGEAQSDSERYVSAARHGMETAPKRQGLLLVLAKFVIGHYYFTLGDFGEVVENNDLSRAVAILPRDLTRRLQQSDGESRYDFGMNRHALGELYRRVQWLAFVIDRYIAITLNYPLCFDKKDQIVRLPCDNEAYDRGDAVQTPYFDNGILGRKHTTAQAEDAPQSIWSYFVQGISFDSDIRSEAHRSEWMDDDVYPGNYDVFAKRTARELDDWLRRLPANLQFNDTNIDHHLQANTIGLFFAIHALYHTCHMNLTRRVRANLLPQRFLDNMARATYVHARAVIEQTERIRCRVESEPSGSDRRPLYQPNPYLGYAIHIAVDVITCCGLSGGHDAKETLELCSFALDAMSRLAVWYAASRGQLTKLEKRVDEIRAVLDRNPGEGAAWVCMWPIQPQEPAYMDTFYQENGGVRNVILALNGVSPEQVRVTYLQQERMPGRMDPTLKAEWGGT